MGTMTDNHQQLKNKASNQYDVLKKKTRYSIQIGSATCENAAGSNLVCQEFTALIECNSREDVSIKRVGCTGQCSIEPIVSVSDQSGNSVKYCKVDQAMARQIFEEHIVNGKPLTYNVVPDSKAQKRLALRNSGKINPECLSDYVLNGGYDALTKVLEKGQPSWVIDQLKESNLRGRGGGGYPTGMKWQAAAEQNSPTKYIICNADEGDPGAFMDRSMLEGDPFSIIEGMTIGAYAIGAVKGYLYIRAEYPMAIDRIDNAIKICRENNLLGDNILGSSFNFDLEIRLGAGAFVCGEETALIQSIEGRRGQPKIRPPFPAQKGLWGSPTVINNVETWTNIPVVINDGPEKFAKTGTNKSGGTKVFALAGKITNTGLVEVPMGTTLREIVYDIGGGVPNGRSLKAIQTGGPAGGCIPVKMIDTPVDFDTLQAAGSIMGSGGMIIMDDTDCMVDVARFFLEFTKSESCGKCTPCREGTTRMLEILEKITGGKGTLEDLDKLKRLAMLVKKASLCGLGRAAPNPVLSTLEHFRDEYIAHVTDKKCPAGKCKALLTYSIIADKCVGCTACAKACPVGCISGKVKTPHVIDNAKCIKCGRCYEVCKFEAVVKS